MKRITKIIGKGLKYAAITFSGGLTLSLGYLQFINYQVGSIEIDRQDLVKFYMEKEKMSED